MMQFLWISRPDYSIEPTRIKAQDFIHIYPKIQEEENRKISFLLEHISENQMISAPKTPPIGLNPIGIFYLGYAVMRFIQVSDFRNKT